ncbi:MAG: FAD-dependent oxidoreductase [Myxococcota bacterium]
MSGRTVVVGGGLAGLAAATVLAEAGAEVTVLEREAYAGGRVGAWPSSLAGQDGRPPRSFEMERGFHAFFRQYYNLRNLMSRIDPSLSMLAPQLDYPVLSEGARESFSGLSKRAPLNVAQLALRTPTLRLRDFPRIDARTAAAMLAYGPHTYERWDRITAKDYLDALRFPPDARRMLFEVFSHSFFNPEDDFSAAELLMQFHFYFVGNPEGLIFDTMRVPFGRGLIEPLLSYLRRRGVEIRRGAPAERVIASPTALKVVAGGREEDADHVVLALPVPALKTLVQGSAGLPPDLQDGVDSLDVTLPFVVWRLWFDRPVKARRAPFAGTTGVGLLDNISVYEKLEDESAEWAAESGGSVVELHAYGVPEHLDEKAIRADLMRGLHLLYPETQDADVLEERYLHRRDCPAFAPGSYARRPGVACSDGRILLAGDFVKLPWPSALMERATMAGFDAANRILDREAQPIRSVPTRGLLSRLRF